MRPLVLVGGDRGAGARENRGREGYGRREKKGREAGSLRWREAGEKFKKAVKETNLTTFIDFHFTFPRLKAKFYTREKSKNENPCSG